MSSVFFLPINPPNNPTGPNKTPPAAALPRLNPFWPIWMFMEKHFGHLIFSPGKFSPQWGHIGAVLDTSLLHVLHFVSSDILSSFPLFIHYKFFPNSCLINSEAVTLSFFAFPLIDFIMFSASQEVILFVDVDVCVDVTWAIGFFILARSLCFKALTPPTDKLYFSSLSSQFICPP